MVEKMPCLEKNEERRPTRRHYRREAGLVEEGKKRRTMQGRKPKRGRGSGEKERPLSREKEIAGQLEKVKGEHCPSIGRRGSPLKRFHRVKENSRVREMTRKTIT